MYHAAASVVRLTTDPDATATDFSHEQGIRRVSRNSILSGLQTHIPHPTIGPWAQDRGGLLEYTSGHELHTQDRCSHCSVCQMYWRRTATRLRSSCACFRSLPSSLLPQPPHSHSRAKRWRRGNDECCSWSDAARRSSARAKRAHACRSRRGHARDILVRLLCIRVHACLT